MKPNEKKTIEELREDNKKLTIKTIDNIIDLVDELKYYKNDKYDETERLIKQGLYLVKFNITTII